MDLGREICRQKQLEDFLKQTVEKCNIYVIKLLKISKSKYTHTKMVQFVPNSRINVENWVP